MTSEDISKEKVKSINESVNSKEAEEEPKKYVVGSKYADVTLDFMLAHDSTTPEATPQEDKKLSRKLMWRVLGLTMLINLMMYMDKATLSYSSILGFWESTGLNQTKYNNVNTIFYVGYIVGQLPGTYLLSKVPLGKLIFGITFLWSIIIFLHCAAYNYAGVIVLRFFLGFTESVAIPLLTTTNGMFLTRDERAATQPVFYMSCLGSPIPTGFIAYGVIYANAAIKGYRVLNIIIGGLTFILSILILFLYPNNPTDAKFLSDKEKVWVIRRVQRSQNITIEQNVFKKHHAIEAFKDIISWLIFFFFLLQQLANNLPYQQTLLFEEMGGVSNLGSTLVTIAGSGFALAWSFAAWFMMYLFPNTTCLTIIWSILPSWLGSVLAVSLNIKNSIGMLAAICMASQAFGVSWICSFGLAATTAGSSYTKRLTRNAMNMVGYCVANLISPQLWNEHDSPRFVPAWIVQIVLSFTVAPALIGVVWFILSRRNKERLAALDHNQKLGVVKNDEDEEIVVNVANLDLTDLEDKSFIYPL